MEKIVSDLQKITIRESRDEILTENRSACINFPNTNTMMTDSVTAKVVNPDEVKTAPETEEDASTRTTRYSLRKCSAQSRASKENALHKIQRRTIGKPTKRMRSFSVCQKPADIEKIYMTKSLTNFRPTNLETIFEEPQSHGSSNSYEESLIGSRKLRRSLSCSDGIVVSKTLTKQRRAKIRRVFGRRNSVKKIDLDDFMLHLKSGTERADESTVIEDSGEFTD